MVEKIHIRLDSPISKQVIALLQEHLQDMYRHSPPESVHALDIESLSSPEISFWAAWSGERLAACAALKKLDSESAELKSMKTSKSFLRQGIGAMLLKHLLNEAKGMNYGKVYLETGSAEAFYPARELYSSYGFVEVGPFAGYELDPHSVFMRLDL